MARNCSATAIFFSDEEDTPIWKFTPNGVHTSQSLSIGSLNLEELFLYMSLMFGHLRSPRVQFFLWLLASNRVLTGDNLAKRQEVANKCCPFCEHMESSHLFFDCVVAKRMRLCISNTVGRNIGTREYL